MNAIDILLNKGSVQISGLVKDKIADAIYKLVCKRNNEILGALVFETRKAEMFLIPTGSRLSGRVSETTMPRKVK